MAWTVYHWKHSSVVPGTVCVGAGTTEPVVAGYEGNPVVLVAVAVAKTGVYAPPGGLSPIKMVNAGPGIGIEPIGEEPK